jgi:hypothetical protein
MYNKKTVDKIPIWFEISTIKQRANVHVDSEVLNAAKEFAKDTDIPLGILVTNCIHEYLRRYNYDTY